MQKFPAYSMGTETNVKEKNMIMEISKNEWARYLGDLSCVLQGWDTKVEILRAEIGAQTLSEGLPFGGITFNERDDEATIGLSLGADAESHITHSISQPVKIAFEDGSLEHGGILDIEDEAGSKTLVSFIRAYAISKVCENTDMIRVR